MDGLMKYDFDGIEIRVVMVDEDPWFVAKDVCDALDHSNTSMAVQGLDDDEKGVRKVYTLGGKQEMMCISEPGLYGLMMKSKVKGAKKFKRWIKHDVLPQIRKTGSYQNKNLIVIDPSKNQPELLQLAADQSKKIKDQEPYVMIANEFLTVPDSLKGTDEIAKELGIGEITLFRILRESKVFHYIYQNKQRVNVPHDIHIKNGRIVVKNRTTDIGTDEEKKINYSRSYFTPKGEAYVCALLQKRKLKSL